MIIPYVRHDTDGRILGAGRAPSVRVALLQKGSVLPGVAEDPELYYVADGFTVVHDEDENSVTFDKALRLRPELPRFDRTAIAADGIDEATLASLPPGAVVSVDGGEAAPAGENLTVSSSMPAAYEVVVSCWPYRDYRETIVAS